MNPLPPGDEGKRAWFGMTARLLFTGLGWGAFYLFQNGPRPLPDRTAVGVLWVLAAAALVNVPYLVVRRWIERPAWFQHLQIIVDILFSSALVYLTGGSRSLFIPFYFASILTACFWRSEAAAVGYASLSAILLSAVTVAYILVDPAGPELPFLDREWVAGRVGVSSYGDLLLQGVSLYIVAFLGGRLATGLHRARHLNDVILQNLTDGVVAVDAKGAVTFVNGEALRLMGAASGGWQGRKVQEVLTLEEAQDLGRVLDGASGRRRETRRQAPGGGGSDYEIRFSPLAASRGQVSGALMVLSDLAPRKRMEEAVLRADRLASSAELAAGIAHEIRNPLASIRGCAQELAAGLRAASSQDAKMLELIVRESDHLNRIVGGVLDFAKPLRLQTRACDLRSLLDETVEVLRARFRGAPAIGASVDVHASVRLEADPTLLRQVFLNLVQNAFQAMIHQGGDLRIEARPETSDLGVSGIRISFTDTGPGIAAEDLPEMFKPFFTRRPGGTGLGLPIANRIVQAHGGEIRVDAKPGRGARLLVWLPQRAAAADLLFPQNGSGEDR